MPALCYLLRKRAVVENKEGKLSYLFLGLPQQFNTVKDTLMYFRWCMNWNNFCCCSVLHYLILWVNTVSECCYCSCHWFIFLFVLGLFWAVVVCVLFFPRESFSYRNARKNTVHQQLLWNKNMNVGI